MSLPRMSSFSRRMVSSLIMLAGVLLVVAALLRFWVAAVSWSSADASTIDATYVALSALMLVLAVLLIRFGWRMRRDGRISDEPGDHSIS